MKFSWVQDLMPFGFPGGAEMNDKAMIVAGLRRGHDIDIVLPGNATPERAELAIISNATGFRTDFYDDLINRGIPYVLFEHDYVNLCRWRLYFPQLDRCKSLCYLRDRWAPYLEKAALRIWLSPLHRDAWLFAYPQLRKLPYALVPSAVNPDEFPGPERVSVAYSRALMVNSGVAFKGWPVAKAWAEENAEVGVTLVGPDPGDMPANMTCIGNVPYERMPELYRDHAYFVHLPDRSMPFERTCVEAKLSGCQLILNKNVGAASYPWMLKGRDEVAKHLRAAPGQFWKAIERAVK